MKRINNTLVEIIDQYTGELVTYNRVNFWIDGTPMDDSKCDGIIYRKLNNLEYFKRNYTGPVNVKWFGAKGDGITNDTPFFQRAIDTFQVPGAILNGVDILIPEGTYLLANLVVKTGISLYANQQVAKDNYIANVPTVIRPFGNPTYIIDVDSNATNWSISNLYIECDFENQPQLLAGCRLRGQKCFFIGNNVNAAAQIAVLNEAGLIYIEKNGIHGWYGDIIPTFTGINDFRGALHVPAMGDSYIYDNEISAGLNYFTSTVTPRDPVNGRIVALALGSIFGGTSVISGNLFENGDRAVAIGNSLYCNFHNNRYELSAMGGLYIYGPMQFATFSQERFSDNSLSVDGAADDITIATGAGGNIVFVAPTFESLVNVAIPNSNFKVNYHISNYGSDLIDMVTPDIDPVYSVNGLVNLSNITNLPVRQVKGQYHPDDPQYSSVSTQKLPAETQVGYVKLKQGTDAATQSLVGAVEFWTPQSTIAYSIGFSPKEYLAITGYEPNPIFAFNGNIALQRNGEAKTTLWSIDGTGNSSIVLQGGPTVTTQSTITLDNTSGDLEVVGSGDIVLGSNENYRLKPNGLTYIPFRPSAGTVSDSFLVGRNETTGEQTLIDPSVFPIVSTPQNANTVYAGPTGGAPVAPIFRNLVSNDIPNLDAGKITTGTFPGSMLGTGSSNYIQNQATSAQTGNFWINGGAIINAVLSVGTGSAPAFPLQVGAGTGISAQFLGRVAGIDALSSGELATLGQIPTAARVGISNTAPITYNSGTGVIGITQATTSTSGYLTNTDWNTFNNKLSTSRVINTTTPLFGGGNLSSDLTIAISDAAADGTTKGAATFSANDFNSTSGLISIDYTNGQAASTGTKGFLTSTDWNTFNNKLGSLNGLNAGSQTFAISTVGTDFNITSSGSVHTFILPDAGASARGLVTTGVQTFAGNKTAPAWIASSSLTCTNATSNFYAPAGAAAITTTVSNYLYAGGANTTLRVGLAAGVTNTSIATNANAANVIVGISSLTSATSGTHAFVSNLVVQRPTITSGGGSAVMTNGVSLYVEGAPTFATNNYAFYVGSGNTKLSGVAASLVNKTADYTATGSDYTITVDSTTGNVIITLPTAGIPVGQIFFIKKTVAANTVTVDPTGAATIDGAANVVLSAQWSKLKVQFDGTNYIIISN